MYYLFVFNSPHPYRIPPSDSKCQSVLSSRIENCPRAVANRTGSKDIETIHTFDWLVRTIHHSPQVASSLAFLQVVANYADSTSDGWRRPCQIDTILKSTDYLWRSWGTREGWIQIRTKFELFQLNAIRVTISCHVWLFTWSNAENFQWPKSGYTSLMHVSNSKYFFDPNTNITNEYRECETYPRRQQQCHLSPSYHWCLQHS